MSKRDLWAGLIGSAITAIGILAYNYFVFGRSISSLETNLGNLRNNINNTITNLQALRDAFNKTVSDPQSRVDFVLPIVYKETIPAVIQDHELPELAKSKVFAAYKEFGLNFPEELQATQASMTSYKKITYCEDSEYEEGLLRKVDYWFNDIRVKINLPAKQFTSDVSLTALGLETLINSRTNELKDELKKSKGISP